MDQEQGIDLKYHLEDISDTTISYNPDDFAPFTWNGGDKRS